MGAIDNEVKDRPRGKVLLVPWDPESEEHVQRIFDQRLACGWKEEEVQTWRDLQREGKMGIHWIVLDPSIPATGSQLIAHTTRFPAEATPLQDTAKTILSQPHQPSPQTTTFVPIGHISLDSWSYKSELHLSKADGIYSITTFYVSSALQERGFGRASMDAMERMAVEDFNARAITLDTISKSEDAPDNPRRVALNRLPPKISNEDWYARRGYKQYHMKKDCYFETDPTGKVWGILAVFMRKDLA